MPFWAILVANFANNWGFHLLMTELPQYLSDIFPEYMNSGSRKGLWTAIPYGTMWVVSLVISFTADKVIKKNILRTAVVRKMSNTLAHIGPSVCLLIIILLVREAFKNKNDETHGIFHMLVNPPPPLPTYGKFFRDFLLSKKDF